MTADSRQAVAAVFREESGKAVATLARVFRSLDLAEEAVQEAFETALRVWPARGIPDRPGAWITTTARNKALDRVRRESRRPDLEASAQEIGMSVEPDESFDSGIPDDRLRLVFTCCHPALNEEARVALTLRLLGGLTTNEIARAFLTGEPAMAKRLVRAKQKIAAARIPYRVPEGHELPDRLDAVLTTLYLIFNEGHTATAGEGLLRVDLCEEAIRLTRLLAALMPDEPEVAGLLALLLLTHARRPARVDIHGRLVRMEDQDRSLWDRDLIAEGSDVLAAGLRRGGPGPYQAQAAIAALHAAAASSGETDWEEIVAVYDRLVAMRPGPVVELNRAVAVAMAHGPAAGLTAAEHLAADRRLEKYPYLYATIGDLQERLGRRSEAESAFRAALQRTENPVERRYLEDRIGLLGE